MILMLSDDSDDHNAIGLAQKRGEEMESEKVPPACRAMLKRYGSVKNIDERYLSILNAEKLAACCVFIRPQDSPLLLP